MKKGIYLINQSKELIYSTEFQSLHRITTAAFSRKRKLPFSKIFAMILKLVKKTLSIECELLGMLDSDTPPSKQAFSKARYKIKHTGFKELAQFGVRNFYNDKTYGTWRGYRVIAADGSSLRLPKSEEIIGKFGLFKPNGTSGEMPPIARISLFVDLCTFFICNARIERWDISEQKIAAQQLEEVVTTMKELDHEKLLFIYDRGYSSLAFMNQHRDLGVDFIFRLQSNFYKEIWEKVHAGDMDFNFNIVNKNTKDFQHVRVVALTLPNGVLEVLVTSLLDRRRFSLDDLCNVYRLRWQIEECYKKLKISAELENFSGVNLEAILQEFWAHIVISNILTACMCDEQGFWEIDNLPEYRLNFSFLFGVMREKIFQILLGKMSIESFNVFFQRAILRAKVKIRPGRSYSRTKVKIPKRHHIFRRIC